MTAKYITYNLEFGYYKNGCKFIVPNIYFFLCGHETDLLIVKNNGMVYDVEIKVSRSDFKADFKKVRKHEIYSTGGYITPVKTCDYISSGNIVWYEKGEFVPSKRPNRFYFAVPSDLVSVSEVPDYAGLLYVYPDGSIIKVKEGQLLHKEKVIDYEKLSSKFYWMWRSQKPINISNKPLLRE